MEAQHAIPRWQRWLEKNWLLIPLGLITVIGVAGFETFALNAPSLIPDLPLQQVTDIPLAGTPTRFDYQSLDPRTRLLFIAHSGANMGTVFNTTSKKVVANSYPLLHGHAVLSVSELGRAYATDSDLVHVYAMRDRTDSTIPKIPFTRHP